MGRAMTDPNGTAVAAEREGVSRRTIQRRLKEAKAAAQADLKALQPQQLTLPVIEPQIITPLKIGAPARISAEVAAARAGSLEKAVFKRLSEAVERGDISAVRLYASAWKEILGGLVCLEKLAEEVERKRSFARIERIYENNSA